MKNNIWILKIELLQNKGNFLFIILISFLLGMSLRLALKAESRISELVSGETWNADLVILPKGISLADFRQELLTNQTSAFLPEALFDTTMSMAKGQFQATAVLALTDEKGSHLFARGTSDNLGLNGLGEKKIENWQSQNTYQTAEWGFKVISGFFASGPEKTMKNLKELIDKRTVGQAIVVKDQVAHDEKIKMQLLEALATYSGILILLIVLSFLSLLLWLKVRISNSLDVFKEIGFLKVETYQLLASLFIFSVIIPVLLGVWIGSAFSF